VDPFGGIRLEERAVALIVFDCLSEEEEEEEEGTKGVPLDNN